MADKRDILIRLLGEETVSRMAGRASDGLGKFGDSLDATERDARDLDRQIGEVEGSLKTLATLFARTSDAADRVDITKAMRKQQTELRKLTKARDLLPDFSKAGEDAATGFGASFVARIGPLLAKAPMGPVGAAIGAAIAIPAAITLSAAIQGAVVGGVGVGGVIGGVALAAKDSRVQAAGKQLGDTIMGDLEDSATRFVSPTIHGIGIIRSAWSDVAGDVDGVFAATSRYVEPLARGVSDAVRELAPGLREAAEAAGPIIREISEGLPRLGRALGDLFSDFADNADEGASAIRYLFMFVESGIQFVDGAVTAFGSLYRTLLDVGEAGGAVADTLWGWLPIIGGRVDEGRKKIAELKGALKEGGDAGGDAGEKIAGGLLKVPPAAATATAAVQTLDDAILESTDRALASENANLRLEQAYLDAASAAKENAGAGIKNTEAGLRNRTALLGIADAAKASAADILKNTRSHELAAVATEEGRAKFLAAAKAMGVEKGEAKALADKLFGIPKKVDSKVTVTANTKPAIDSAKSVVARINNMHARIKVSAEPSGGYGGSAHTGDGYSTGMSEGGPVIGSGPKGVDSVPAMLAPGEHVLTAREVDAAGGQAGVERIRALLRGEGAGGASLAGVAAGSRGGGGTRVVAPSIQINAAGASGLERVFVAWLVKAIRDGGGNPKVLGLGGDW